MTTALNFADAIAGIPVGQAFADMDPSEQHASAAVVIRRVLDQLDSIGREADEYEREHLYHAIASWKAGHVEPVFATIGIACRVPGERLPVMGAANDIFSVPTEGSLRDLFEAD